MAWTDSKRDWVSADIFTLDDWNRILNNAKYLYALVGATFPWKDCTLADTMAIPYYDIVNNLENNLERLKQHAEYSDSNFSEVIWYPITSTKYSHNPSYVDFNRWETFEDAFKKWYEIVSVQLNRLKSGTFAAGNNRVRQYFGRSV